MRNKMEKLAKQLGSMYLTDSPVNFDDDNYGYKYFICFHNTHKVVFRGRNIPETIEALQNIIENGVCDGSGIFY
ncbi:MAG: hypothetical protein ACRDD7_11210 [Peptostreptococcaceae bacterium]